MMDYVVIVGGGHAAIQCAMKLREYGYQGGVKILTEESHYPYHRPPLSKKYLTGEVSEQDLYIVNPKTIAEKNIEVVFSVKVTQVDLTRKQVICQDQRIDYSHLVIATGARPRHLPLAQHQVSNLHYCRNMDDIRHLAEQLDAIEKIAIIGGGYIGLELAATLRTLGKTVTVLERAERILNRVACSQTAAFIKQAHLNQGVQIYESVNIEQIVFQGTNISALKLDNEIELSCDAVIAGIGVIPNTQFLGDDFEKSNDSLLVNVHCQTNQPDVFAIGDCTIFNLNGVLTKLESVQNANEQADIVAKFIVGQQVSYQPKPWFWSDQYDLKIQIAGLARDFDSVIERRSDSKVSYWYFKEKELIAVDAINDARAFMMGKKFIGLQVISPELIHDSNADVTKNFH
ncbi:NAD(P)/FAD-dependent oxidoreductase [Acinetobacter schindleri]|jgi:3-phenylpropionate/trans-cinnamate dioxygenase ferredoxin reductase subunit|uniref:NAD(P)/FAD-dependent oxidoreductase n=1 Tax=Acinetobacter schindleri TaxID=108981 RepID=UPI00289D91F9|nr:FAD-dependent oxidoreductase [Acinetobacter schindleri]